MARFHTRWRSFVLIGLTALVGIGFAAWRGASVQAAGSPAHKTGSVQAGAPNPEAGSVQAGAPKLKAGEIVDAVLFNDGPAARYLTALRRGPTRWTEELRRLQREIKLAVEKDPAYAANFAAQMQSGNPLYTARAMSSVGVIVREELDEMYGYRAIDEAVAKVDQAFGDQRLAVVQDQAAVQNFEFSYDNGNDVWFAVDAVVAVTAVAVVAVLVVASAIDFTPHEYSERTMLAHEVFVNHLATDLRTPR